MIARPGVGTDRTFEAGLGRALTHAPAPRNRAPQLAIRAPTRAHEWGNRTGDQSKVWDSLSS